MTYTEQEELIVALQAKLDRALVRERALVDCVYAWLAGRARAYRLDAQQLTASTALNAATVAGRHAGYLSAVQRSAIADELDDLLRDFARLAVAGLDDHTRRRGRVSFDEFDQLGDDAERPIEEVPLP